MRDNDEKIRGARVNFINKICNYSQTLVYRESVKQQFSSKSVRLFVIINFPRVNVTLRNEDIRNELVVSPLSEKIIQYRNK
jgi:hypothetical protein